MIGGGHAGVEAAWAAANMLGGERTVALVTMDPTRIGVMSCNPAVGGLAKGQLVREIDALGGVMGLATDATGIQFRVLNTSKGPAVHGPRAQCDKHAYARAVQRLVAERAEIEVVGGSVERLIVESEVVQGLIVRRSTGDAMLRARAVVLTTGTFMRGLMHTGESKTEGGRYGENAAVGISAALKELGFELGRLKTGTPPRLRRGSIAWETLEEQRGDKRPQPFSDLTVDGFPALQQVDCRITQTSAAIHGVIRDNLHRAPMYSGQIESMGPRYCPSIEDKVVRFSERDSHHVYLEPESLDDDWVYCNGISTSLPRDVQDSIVRGMPGCERAEILRYGYAVEYDMVKPHQIDATSRTKRIAGLFLAGQINGTSGYEEAAAQGVVAGINAARRALGREAVTIGRDRAYIGVLMDDLATKTPTEPYRMFTSRAEHRLRLRADNAADRLTPLAEELGLLGRTVLGRARLERFRQRREQVEALQTAVGKATLEGIPLTQHLRRPEFATERMLGAVGSRASDWLPGVAFTVHTDGFYEKYLARSLAEASRSADAERRRIPEDFDYRTAIGLRTEARQSLDRFRPATLGQAGRLEGITPADLTLLCVLVNKHRASGARPEPAIPSGR